MKICRLRCMAAALLLVMTAAGATDEINQQLMFADALMARGLYEYAIREYLVFQERNPGYERMDQINFRVGEAYRRLNNPRAAATAYRRVIETEPKSPYRHRAMMRYAEIYREFKRPELEVLILRNLLADDPEQSLADTAHYWLGRSLAATGDRDAALSVWRDFLAAGRESSVTPFIALELAKKLADHDDPAVEQLAEAEKWLQHVVDNPPDARHGAEALYYLARLAENSGDDTRAATLFDDFLKQYPDDIRVSEARLPAAWTYYRKGRYADSLRLCAAALPDATSALDQWLYLKGNNQRRLANHSAAVDTYTRLLQETPQSPLAPVAALEKAQSELQMGDPRRALQTMKTVRITAENRLDALWLLAAAHDAAGAGDDAMQNYRLLIDQFPDTDQAYEAAYRMALLFQRRGDARQAAEAYQQVADRYPLRSMAPRALLASAELLRSIGRHAESVRNATRFLDQYGDHALAGKALYQKAVGEAVLDRADEAIRSFQEMAERFPDSDLAADAAFMLGVLYAQQGKDSVAETEFTRALRSRPGAELRNRILFQRAMALQRMGKDSESATLFRDLLDDPRTEHFDPSLLEWLSKQMRSENRPLDAIRVADRLIERAGANPGWMQTGHSLAGLAAVDAGKTELAVRRFEAALEADIRTPFTAETAVRLGELLLQEGKIEAARRRFQKGEAVAQEETLTELRAQALMGLGACDEAAGDLAGANRYYSLVGLTYDIPQLSARALRKAADTFDKMGRAGERDQLLLELEERYGPQPQNP